MLRLTTLALLFLLTASLTACTPLKRPAACALQDTSTITKRIVLMPEDCLKRIAQGSSTLNCPFLTVLPYSASLQIPLPATGFVEYTGKHQIMESGNIEFRFPYSTPDLSRCTSRCSAQMSQTSESAIHQCVSQCHEDLMAAYGKTEASFPVTIHLRLTSDEALVVSTEGRDPHPVPGKSAFEFANPFTGPLRCIGQ